MNKIAQVQSNRARTGLSFNACSSSTVHSVGTQQTLADWFTLLWATMFEKPTNNQRTTFTQELRDRIDDAGHAQLFAPRDTVLPQVRKHQTADGF